LDFIEFFLVEYDRGFGCRRASPRLRRPGIGAALRKLKKRDFAFADLGKPSAISRAKFRLNEKEAKVAHAQFFHKIGEPGSWRQQSNKH
jgi:hypothetical protein